jgi:hypothetical protein
MGARNLEHRGNKDLWDKFWGREREIKKVYSNEGRVCQNLSRVVDVEGKRILVKGQIASSSTIR